MSTLNVDTIQDKGGAFEHARLVQVQTTNKVDYFTTSSTSLVDVTGLSVAITPTNSNNKILILASFVVGVNTSGGYGGLMSLLRGSTKIASGDGTSAGAINDQTLSYVPTSDFNAFPVPVVFLDSPSTTSSTTYKIQLAAMAGGNSANVGGRGDGAGQGCHSSILAMEIRT